MAINTYALLTAEVKAWADRAGDAAYVAESDNLIALAEAEFNLILNQYRQETSVNVLTDVTGMAALPADFSVIRSLSYPPYGTLKQTSLDGLAFLNPAGVGGVPYHFAISGQGLFIDRATAATLHLIYVAGVPALSSGNPANWLLTAAPHAYLFMCMAMGEAFNGNFAVAEGLEAKARAILDELTARGQLAQFSRAEMTLRGIAP